MRKIAFVAAAALWASVATAQTDIQKIQNAPWFERTIAQGVTWKYYHFDDLFGEEQDVHVTTIDQNVAGTGLKLNHRMSGGAVVPTYATDFTNTAATINGNFFNTTTKVSVQFMRINGSVITTTQPSVQDEGGVIIDASGIVDTAVRPGSGNWADRTEPNVMATNVPLLSNGALYSFPNEAFYTSDHHPRTAVGKTLDNKVLLVAVDGRRTHAAGMTLTEMRTLFQGLGANNAVNMDGGGSTTMWVKGEPGNQVVNVPSDGSLRTVANALSAIGLPSTTTLPYDSRLVSISSYNNTMESGTTQQVTMTFRNYGTTAWGAGTTLHTTEARDRTSGFFTTGDWTSASNAGALNQASVATGADGTFTFTITAPSVGATTVMSESFGMHDTTGGFLGPEQNRLSITVLPPGGLTGSVIVEARAGGLNQAWYSDTLASGWADSGTSCTAPGLTAGIGMRYGSTFRSVAGSKRAQFKPTINAGTYNVYVAWGAGTNRKPGITYIVNHKNGQATVTLDQTQDANTWVLLGQYEFDAGNAGYVEVNNSAVDVSGSMYAAGAKWEPVSSGLGCEWTKY